MSTSQNVYRKQRKQPDHSNQNRIEIKPGALLGPLAWDPVSQEESRYRTEVGLAPLLDARNVKGHLAVPFFFVGPTLAKNSVAGKVRRAVLVGGCSLRNIAAKVSYVERFSFSRRRVSTHLVGDID